MKRFEIFFGLIKIPTDFLMTILASCGLQLRRSQTWSAASPKPSISPCYQPPNNIFSAKAAPPNRDLRPGQNVQPENNQLNFPKSDNQLISAWSGPPALSLLLLHRTFPFPDWPSFTKALTWFSWFLAAPAYALSARLLHLGIGQSRLLFIGNNKITEEIAKNKHERQL